MAEQLKGEIIWYGGANDAIFIGRLSGFIDDNLIKLTIEPNDEYSGYDVTLNRREIGTLYDGTYKETGSLNNVGSVGCEVFKSREGREKFILSGNWYENENYFWYAKLSFKKFPVD
ncbi:hypothetical protein [Chitinophaga sancti]|uniref:Uncharacterized protein n=1 Tax=Chitinophaga sancti TaxID=1004 RepID=A0A1K1T3W1_9BACT|nr:hypothetical protein [Chitinophaga sancti]WQD61427.1 hypothetical protein U0033_26480 [Chitinophaga sancti]WQG93020.1 hypothetical protein SR876_15980 [Chitinophaga sancti]SFW91212.1 hypothetical protein SAMN05661012_06748 [Chitinophaga sancti]